MPAFSLQTDPFPEDTDTGHYFDTPALAAQQDALLGIIENGDVLLVDAFGSGKSTALERFVATVDGRMRVFFVRMRTSHDARALSDALVGALGLPLREPVAAELRDADAFLELVTGRGQRAVIVIDDAHRLERGALEQLLYLFKRWERYNVRFLIGAEPELCERLEGLDAADRLFGRVTRLDMPRFDDEQIGDYLNLCLYRAGLSGDSPFDADRIARIAARARGLVGAVDPAARALLNESMLEGSRGCDGPQRSARRWSRAIVAVAALGVVGMAALAWKTPTRATPLITPTVEGATVSAGAAGFRSSIAPRRRPADAESWNGSAAGSSAGIP